MEMKTSKAVEYDICIKESEIKNRKERTKTKLFRCFFPKCNV